MDDYKIIQIVPNNKELYSKYKDDGGGFTTPIVCFALVEDNDGNREVVPMDITDDGLINIVSDNLEGIVTKYII
ncbi:hypothetical protein [Clostridium gasigenes]|uniref:hypothetical protein n=1 Tax=Clostridium gasigenes TaxID=94869 RepID=UPI001C0C7413|nr:hypothetical protein [Clostridium gasigenes]MBU3107159.1 hypothetical protein [Clostridium gasigenes]